tara:strand:- start:1066 stop:1476 length:411 start_codon:yes stop_codon:yes gene_type:complete
LNDISDKDKKDWKNFIEGKERLFNKDVLDNQNLSKNNYDTIDLHGYSLEDANKIISEFIEKSFNKGIYKINIVTGKGSRSNNKNDPYRSKDLALLKYSVPNYIQNNPDLMKKINKIDVDSINSPLKGSFDIFLKKN